jgi:hypoxanthine phosphoribosyltransferase
MFNWKWLQGKLKRISVKGVLYFLFMLAIGEGIWAGLSGLIENPTTRDIGFLIILISAIFAVTWYIIKQSSAQPAVQKGTVAKQKEPQESYKIPSGTQGTISLSESPSWEQVYSGVEYLSELITEDYSPELIVGISSGGAVIGGMLSRLLNKPLTQVVRSEPQLEETKPDSSTLLSIPFETITGRRVLLVDDIVVSGNTLSEHCEKITEQKNHPSEVRSAALLLAGAHWKKKPDFCAFKTSNTEVRMPWDYIKKVGRKTAE